MRKPLRILQPERTDVARSQNRFRDHGYSEPGGNDHCRVLHFTEEISGRFQNSAQPGDSGWAVLCTLVKVAEWFVTANDRQPKRIHDRAVPSDRLPTRHRAMDVAPIVRPPKCKRGRSSPNNPAPSSIRPQAQPGQLPSARRAAPLAQSQRWRPVRAPARLPRVDWKRGARAQACKPAPVGVHKPLCARHSLSAARPCRLLTVRKLNVLFSYCLLNLSC